MSLPKYINLHSNSGTNEVINITDSLFCNWQITVVPTCVCASPPPQNFLYVLTSPVFKFCLNCGFKLYVYYLHLSIKSENYQSHIQDEGWFCCHMTEQKSNVIDSNVCPSTKCRNYTITLGNIIQISTGFTFSLLMSNYAKHFCCQDYTYPTN